MNYLKNNYEPITVGLPANGRLGLECAPLKEALELKGERGLFKSDLLPQVKFREVRVKDIARFLRSGVYALGIIGDDTALENDLDLPGQWKKVRPFGWPFADDLPVSKQKSGYPDEYYDSTAFYKNPRWIKASPYRVEAENKCDTYDLGQPSTLSLIMKEEEAELFRPDQQIKPYPKPRGTLLTPYPNLSRKLTMLRGNIDFGATVIDGNVTGQIESMVRNGDLPDVFGAIEVVKTGDTMRRYGLTKVLDLLESRPGLWKSPVVPEKNSNQVRDVICEMRLKLIPYLRGFEYLRKK